LQRKCHSEPATRLPEPALQFSTVGTLTAITLNNDVCSCGSNENPGALVLHEVGHALGFFHVADRNSVMYPFLPGNCPSGQLSAAEKFHAAIAYSRPRGNRDPDIDPVAGQFVTSPPALRVQN
jgi:hypothetical protein